MNTDLRQQESDVAVKDPDKSDELKTGHPDISEFERFNLVSCMDDITVHNKGTVVECTQISTSLGSMTACATQSGLCILEFDDSGRVERQIARHRRLFKGSYRIGQNVHLSKVRRELNDYMNGKLQAFSVALDLKGTPFQCTVWKALLALPYGARITYSELAHSVGKPKAVRAAAAANGMNPVSILVPCHRVLGGNGSLTGYGGGIERKSWLLNLESDQNCS